MGWFDWSEERKAMECETCKKVLFEGLVQVCDECGHLYNDCRARCPCNEGTVNEEMPEMGH